MESQLSVQTALVRYQAPAHFASIESVLDALDRAEQLSENAAQIRQRRYARTPYLSSVEIRTSAENERLGVSQGVAIFVQARDVSAGGIGLIVAPYFEPVTADEMQPVFKAGQLFRVGQEIILGLPTKSSPIWMIGRIVRMRELRQRYFDVGIKYMRRQDVAA